MMCLFTMHNENELELDELKLNELELDEFKI